jgi:poly(hydroxyalkanoate) granule-associated protein
MTTEDTATTGGDAKTAADLDIARKIWLAGVGAYGRLYAETAEAVEKLASTANETFDDLVAKGEEVEDRVRKSLAKNPPVEKMAHAVETATAKAQTFTSEQRAHLEERLGKVRETVAEAMAPWNLPAIGQALEKLSAQVEALTQEVAALKTRDTAAASAATAKNQTPPVK